MALWLVAPAACSSRMTGKTLSANCCAVFCTLARPIAAAFDRLGLPRRTPRSLAAVDRLTQFAKALEPISEALRKLWEEEGP
jgi:hypothetical protein